MVRTRPINATSIDRAKADPVFRRGLLREALLEFADGNGSAARILISEYLKACPSEGVGG